MVPLPRIIQGLIVFSAALGVPFLIQVNGVVPSRVFDFVAAGWVLFVFDAALSFYRQRVSFYLGLVLGAAALASTMTEPAHFSLIQGGNLAASATIITGSVAEAMLVALVVLFIVQERRKDEWAWPGAKSPA